MAVEAKAEYQVFTPVKTFTGETAKIEFYRGRAVIDDDYARAMGYANAEEVVRILVSDFGYTSSPVLPAPVPLRDSRLSLRERAERAEPTQDAHVTPFYPPEQPVGETHESTIEPGTSRSEPLPPDPDATSNNDEKGSSDG